MLRRTWIRIKDAWKHVEIGPLPPTLILVGVCLYFFAYAKLEGSPFEQIAHDLAISSFILGGFSLLIELGHIKEYISRRLRDVVMRREYLQILDAPELTTVKRDVDAILFGRGVLEKGTLFRFMDDLRASYIGSHYRENSRDFITIENDPEYPEAVILKRNLSYLLVKGHFAPEKRVPTFGEQGKPSKPMIVQSKWMVDVIMGLGRDIEKYLLRTEITVASPNFTDKFVLSKNDRGGLELAPKAVSRKVDPIALGESITNDSDVVGWEFLYEVPEGADLESGAKLEISRLEELRIPKDDLVYVSVAEPANGLMVNFRAPKGTKCRVATFGLVPRQSKTINRAKEEVVIMLDGWVLPGHGWAVAWFPQR